MPKKTNDEKINAVKRYIEGKTSQKGEARKLGVSQQTFQDWIRIYETFGTDGFWKEGNRRYSSELKEAAVKAYLNGEVNQGEICKKCQEDCYNCNNALSRWYLSEEDALRLRRKGLVKAIERLQRQVDEIDRLLDQAKP